MGICNTCSCLKTSGRVRNVLTGEVSSAGEEQIRICVSVPVGDIGARYLEPRTRDDSMPTDTPTLSPAQLDAFGESLTRSAPVSPPTAVSVTRGTSPM